MWTHDAGMMSQASGTMALKPIKRANRLIDECQKAVIGSPITALEFSISSVSSH
jgi:hypothetical protein